MTDKSFIQISSKIILIIISHKLFDQFSPNLVTTFSYYMLGIAKFSKSGHNHAYFLYNVLLYQNFPFDLT